MIVARSWELNTQIKAQAVRLVLDEGKSVVPSPAISIRPRLLFAWCAVSSCRPARERAAAGRADASPKTTLSGVPKTLPSLLRAFEISARAAAVGFDWGPSGRRRGEDRR